MRFLLALVCGLVCSQVIRPVRAEGCPVPKLSDGVSFSVERRADNALVADARVQLAAPAAAFIEYGNDQVGWFRTVTAPATLSHHFPLVRLIADQTYQAHAFLVDDAGCNSAGASASFQTGQLPRALRGLQVAAEGVASFPLSMMDLRAGSTAAEPGEASAPDRWLTVFDQQGRPVWYYEIARVMLRIAPGHGANSFIKLSSGNFLYLVMNAGLEEITPDGQVVRRIRMPDALIHHDLVELPDGRVLVIGTEIRTLDDSAQGGPANQPVRGDTLLVVDLDQDTETVVWNAWDILDPASRNPLWADSDEDGAQDWMHTNTVSIGPRGNLIISSRFLNQVISLAPDFRSIEWKLGGDDSSFSFPSSSDHFYAQHSVRELPGDRLLMFDNGNFRPEDDHSRALELQLDYGTMTARMIWEYRPQPDIFSDRLSSVQRLPNGNTLVNFGFRVEPQAPVVAVEARPDGTVAWQLSIAQRGSRMSRFRVATLDSIMGETAVSPTPLLEP